MKIYLTFETDGMCSGCARRGLVEESRMLCLWCLAQWCAKAGWIIKKKREPKTLTEKTNCASK